MYIYIFVINIPARIHAWWEKSFLWNLEIFFLSFLVTIYIIKVKVLINREIKEGYSNAWWVKYLQEEGPQLLNQFW